MTNRDIFSRTSIIVELLNMAKPFAHLRQAQVQELIDRYYKGESVRSLLDAYKVDLPASRLVLHFPPEQSVTTLCRYCSNPLERLRSSRYSPSSNRPFSCSACGHKSSGYCSCAYCRQAASAERDALARTAAVEAAEYNLRQFAEHPPVPVQALSFRNSVSLLAVMRAMKSSGEQSCVGPALEAALPVCPTFEMTYRILSELYEIGVLLPTAGPSDSVASVKHKIECSDLLSMAWALNCGDFDILELDSSLRARLGAHATSGTVSSEAQLLWSEITCEECRQIMNHLWSERNIKMPGYEKVADTISSLLRDFSVSEIYFFFWIGAARTSDAIAKGSTNSFQAPYYALQVARNKAAEVLQGKIERRRFNRNPLLTRSEISYVLFDTVLGIGEHGFTERPNLYLTSQGESA
ncbi:MAG: hypothetical protein ACK5D9_01395 [Burkholderiales bacterium]